MHISVLDLFSIGIGPSSSHTVGPMRAACHFIKSLKECSGKYSVARIRCDLFGSLAATGVGHGTGQAIVFGLMGELPESIQVETMQMRLQKLEESSLLRLPWGQEIAFEQALDLNFKNIQALPLHPNGMHFVATDQQGEVLQEQVYFSVGEGSLLQTRN